MQPIPSSSAPFIPTWDFEKINKPLRTGSAVSVHAYHIPEDHFVIPVIDDNNIDIG